MHGLKYGSRILDFFGFLLYSILSFTEGHLYLTNESKQRKLRKVQAMFAMLTPDVREWLRTTLKKHWPVILGLVLVSLLMAGLAFLLPLALKWVINSAVDDHVFNAKAVALYTSVLVFYALPFQTFLTDYMSSEYGFIERTKALQHLLSLSLGNFHGKNSTEIMTKVDDGIDSGGEFLRVVFGGDLFVTLPIAISSFFYILVRVPVAAFAILGFSTLLLLCSSAAAKRRLFFESIVNDSVAKLSVTFREAIDGIIPVKVFRAEEHIARNFLTTARERYGLRKKYRAWRRATEMFARFASNAPSFIILVLVLPKYLEGKMSFGDVIAMQTYGAFLSAPLSGLGRTYQEVASAVAKLKPFLAIMQEVPQIKEAVGAIELPQLASEIRMNNVSFTYPGNSADTLKDVSLVIPVGASVGIVGPTGSGKTTLINLLARLYDPTRGTVTFDGTDLRLVTLESLFRQVLIYTQDSRIFSGTIEDNLLFGIKATNQEISAVCNAVSAPFILERGLASDVGENGRALSGGERQRLALARTLLRRPRLLILDEATSALDQETEREVKKTFDLLRQDGTTMVMIAHRLSTVRSCEKIVVVEAGMVVAEGTHEQLLERCALYERLCREMDS